MWDHLFGKEMFKVVFVCLFLSLCPCLHTHSSQINKKSASELFFLQVDFADTSVIITEPYFNFSSIQESMNEILFEEYQFQSVLRINGESNPTC